MPACVILNDAFLSVDGNDISAFVKSLTLNYGSATQDSTTMGDSTMAECGSLKEWSISAEVVNNEASIGGVVFPLVGTTVPIIVRQDNSDGVSATNPNFTGNGTVTGFSPLGGSVGDLNQVPLEIVNAGTLTRATS